MALTIEERRTQLRDAKQRRQSCTRDHPTPPPKIQRVAHYLRDRKHFAKHYSPKLVSIGPIHYPDKNLQLGMQYKLMWADMYVERTGQDPETLYEKIKDNVQELKDLFTKDAIQGFNDLEELSWMLFVDGCSLLQILDKGKLDNPEEMNVKVDQLVLVLQDVLLLENQIPFQVLKLLTHDEDEAKLMQSMTDFLHCHHLSPDGPVKRDVSKRKHKDEDRTKKGDRPQEHKLVIQQVPPLSPAHLLDYLYKTILTYPKKAKEVDQKQNASKENNKNQNQNEDAVKENFNMITHRNLKELRAAGIALKSSQTRRLGDISFSCGWLAAELKLPEIIVDDTTAPTFLNLIAYEMCSDFKNDYEICSFVAFMDSLVDDPDDVKELRSVGILHNALGSDDEVAKLFNTISTDLVPDTERYARTRAQIEKHYRNKCKTWIALGYHTYFSNPWAIIAFHAAVLALALTFIQTWFAINPAKS